MFENKDGTTTVGGIKVLEDIAPNEAFLHVPNKCIISVEHAYNSEIGEIFKNPNHESLFVTNMYRESLILTMFVLYEMLKAEESFWCPYFEYLGTFDDYPPLWD